MRLVYVHLSKLVEAYQAHNRHDKETRVLRDGATQLVSYGSSTAWRPQGEDRKKERLAVLFLLLRWTRSIHEYRFSHC